MQWPTILTGISETTQLQMEEGNLQQDKYLLGLESTKAIMPAVKTKTAYCSCLWLSLWELITEGLKFQGTV